MKKLVIILLCTISVFANAQTSENKNMYNLLVKFTVKADAVTEFKEACVNSLIESRKEAGNVEMKLYADDNKENVFFVYSRWENEAAYENHKSLPHSINITKVAKESLQEAPEVMVLGTTTPAPEHNLKQLNPEDQEKTIFFIFKIKEGYRDRIIDRFETHVKHSRTEQGNLFFDFYTIDGEDNTFVVFENWRNKSAIWDIHMKQPYSEVTGALINEAMIGEMDQYMNFISEINKK